MTIKDLINYKIQHSKKGIEDWFKLGILFLRTDKYEYAIFKSPQGYISAVYNNFKCLNIKEMK